MKKRDIWLSFSMISDFQRCPRIHYWKRTRKLEKAIVSIPFLTGRIAHAGIHQIYKNPKKVWDVVSSVFKKEKKEIMSLLVAEDEAKVDEQELIVKGMTKGYYNHYKKFIKSTKLIHNEVGFKYTGIEGVVVVGQVDNIFERTKKWFVHELKTSKELTPSSVQAIKTRLQPVMYVYMPNMMKIGKKISGIIFDIIKKPGIRQKQKETYQEYVQRLIEWYDGNSGNNVFHMEVIHIKDFLLTQEMVMNTVTGIAGQMKIADGEKEAYIQDFQSCHDGFLCDYYNLCLDRTRSEEEIIKCEYQTKKPYKVTPVLRG